MKKYYMAAAVCLASVAAFSQTGAAVIMEKSKDPKTIDMAAKADTKLIDRKAIMDEPKRKRPRREAHKECSRMKS